MKASEYLVNLCREAGITEVFAVTGGGAMHLDDAFGHSEDMRVTYHHHEQACAIAAEAYARASGKPALCLVTSGPGAVNAMTGALCAWMESIPMLVISGQVRYATTARCTGLAIRSLGIQEYDIEASVAPMTKYAAMITDAQDLERHVTDAFSAMLEGRPGPVWLDVPLDVQAAGIEDADEQRFAEKLKEQRESLKAEAIPDETIGEIIDRLSGAKRPLIFGGNGIRIAGADKEFLTLLRHLGAPVLTGMSSIDLIDEDDPLYAGRTGILGTRAGNINMATCDVFFSIGSRQSIQQTGFNYEAWAKDAYTIINDIDAEELKKPNLHVSLPVAGDLRELIEKLLAELERRGCSPEHPLCDRSNWLSTCRERRKKYPAVSGEQLAPQTDGKVNVYAFYHQLSSVLKEGDHVVASCGTARVAGTQAFSVKKGQRFIVNSSVAPMGYGLPAAIGASRALGEIQLIDGEGSLMMNLQEMMTISTNRLPVRLFVIDNEGYHSIRQTQRTYFDRPLIGIGPESNDLGFPDFSKVAETFGFTYGESLSNETLREDMESAMRLPLPALVLVKTTPLQYAEPKVAARKLDDGTMVSGVLEDMKPFLPRDVLEEELRDIDA